MKARRKGMTAAEKTAAGDIVCEKLKALSDIGNMVDSPDTASPLAVYLASRDEVNIDPFIACMMRAVSRLSRHAGMARHTNLPG